MLAGSANRYLRSYAPFKAAHFYRPVYYALDHILIFNICIAVVESYSYRIPIGSSWPVQKSTTCSIIPLPTIPSLPTARHLQSLATSLSSCIESLETISYFRTNLRDMIRLLPESTLRQPVA